MDRTNHHMQVHYSQCKNKQALFILPFIDLNKLNEYVLTYKPLIGSKYRSLQATAIKSLRQLK